MSEQSSYQETNLSRRERQIMDVVYRLGSATVADIVAEIPDPPTRGALRRTLKLMEAKKLLRCEQSGPRKVYLPTAETEEVRGSVLDRVVATFFGGSAAKAMASLYERSQTQLSVEEREALVKLIERADEEGR
jgi:predicted transcriptional regulator